MQNSDNYIVLLGNIVSKDNQLKYFANGNAMLELEIITKRKWRNSKGELQELSHYFGITLVGELAQKVATGAKAGRGIYVRVLYHQPRSQSLITNDRLEASFARIIDRPTSLHWNQVHMVGKVVEWSSIAQTISGQDLLTIKVALPNSDSDESYVEVKLKGSAAKFTYQQLTEQEGAPPDAFIEGALASQSQKLSAGFSHHYWIDARTCIIS